MVATYVIPIAAAVIGALIGIVASVCYMRRRNRNAARTHSTDSSETGRIMTIETPRCLCEVR